MRISVTWRAWAPAIALLFLLLGCGGSGSEVKVETISDEERAKRLENLPPQQRALVEMMSRQNEPPANAEGSNP